MKKLLFLLFICPLLLLSAQSREEGSQLRQGYLTLGMIDKWLDALLDEHKKLRNLPAELRAPQEHQLLSELESQWEYLLHRRSLFNGIVNCKGENAGWFRYRVQDLPPQLEERLWAYASWRRNPGNGNGEQFTGLFEEVGNYIARSPNASEIDRIVSLVYRGELSQARAALAQLRREHPDFCPERLRAFAESLAATPPCSRLALLIQSLRLPLGTIRHMYIEE